MYDNDNEIWNVSDDPWCPCCGPDYICKNCGAGLMSESVYNKEGAVGTFCEDCAK